MMKKLSLILVLVLFTFAFAIAQRSITGKVTDSDGVALIGASVVVKGTTVGTITDIDGNFALNVADDANTVIISYTGFAGQEIDITNQSVLNITLSEGKVLNEVVVTGLGTKRNSRDVSYANQTVAAEDLLSAPNKNTLEALRGKIAGVKISTGSGSVGASTRIVLRGEGSLTGNNNALIVVDGIPIDNASSRGGDGSASTGYTDYGNRFNDLNPNDIESVTVLKGPSATSLYGSRGASGVLVITTKKGGSGDKPTLSVGFNSTASMEEAYVLLQRQDQYGQGYGLPFATTPAFDSGENWSWGPAFDGVVRPWTSPVDADGDGDVEYLSRPYNAVPNQLDNFFRTGSTFDNNVYLSGSNKGFSYYASYSNTNQQGILDNTNYSRNTVKLSATAKLSERLTSDFSVSYAAVDQNSAQEGSRPFEGQNAYANAVQSPVNIPFQELRDYNSPFHNFDGYYGSYTTNPYYILNEYINNGKINNLLGTVSTTFNVMKGLDITGRIGVNSVTRNIVEATPQYAYNDHYIWEDNLAISLRGGRQNTPGYYGKTTGQNSNLDMTLLANYQRNLTANGDVTLNTVVGFNDFYRTTKVNSGATVGGLVVPGFYNLSNSVGASLASESNSRYRIRGLYGNASVGYKNKAFLEYSARNDWSSTLPELTNSFFYQSVGTSIIVSEFLNLQENDYFNYLKVRASVGTTGKDAPIYALQSSFIGNPTFQSLANGHDLTFPLNGQPGFTLSNAIGNPDLKPELTLTYEAGIDATFLKDKVNVEYTFYRSQHTQQLVSVSLPSSTGFTSTIKNIGEIVNQGHELSLNLRPIAGLVDGLSWDLNFIYATNRNEVIKVSDEQDELVLGSFGNLSVVAAVGQPYGSFKGVTLLEENGQAVVDNAGLPRLTDDESFLGSYQPDYTASIGSQIGYKGVGFNILFDIKKGGQFVSYTKDLTEFNGTALTTLIGDRKAFVAENSVVENEDGTFSANTVETNAYDYLRVQPFSEHLIDASYVKLREIGLSYQLPASMFKGLPVSDVSVRLFGKNLKFWLPEDNIWADPEVNGPSLTGNASGIETTQTPPSKSYGINLNVKF